MLRPGSDLMKDRFEIAMISLSVVSTALAVWAILWI